MDTTVSAQLVIRASSTSDYADCPRRWAAKHLRTEIEAMGYALRTVPVGIGAIVGTSVHAYAAVALAEQVKTGELAPISVAKEAAMTALEEGLRGDVLTDETTPHRAHAELQTGNLCGVWRQHLAPKITPKLVEGRLEASFSPEILLSGQQDVVTDGAVRDLKTGRWQPNCLPQLGVYSMLVKTHGYAVHEAIEDWLPRTPISRPQPRPQSFRHDVETIEQAAMAVLRHIRRDVNAFRQGDDDLLPGDPHAFVANPASRLCSASWCVAHGSKFCEEHKRNA